MRPLRSTLLGLALGTAAIGIAAAAEAPGEFDTPSTAYPVLQTDPVMPPRDRDSNRDGRMRGEPNVDRSSPPLVWRWVR
jgi:hypothetical protein